MRPREIARHIGYVPQNPWMLFYSDNVLEELLTVARNIGLDMDIARKKIFRIATIFGIDHLLDRSPLTASEGEARRIAIASALVHEPQILFLDEPTAGLDYSFKKRFIENISSVIDILGVSIATHDIDFLYMFNRDIDVVVLDSGNIVYRGGIDSINMDMLYRYNIILPQAYRVRKVIRDILGVDLRDNRRYSYIHIIKERCYW